jgi:orotidine-5'-phosphate decarboxylase
MSQNQSSFFIEKLKTIWAKNNSLVCVGLDPDTGKLPVYVKTERYPIFAFNKAIIDATHDLVCAYKPQIAYYAAYAAEDQLAMTIDHIRSKYPEVPVILDAKRGDIGSTADMYAKEAFDRYRADALTVNPYMGGDTLMPYLSRKDKGVVILCKTSNKGSADIQDLKVGDTEVYKIVARKAATEWNTNNNVVLVIGATYPEEMAQVRAIAPEIPFLVPGVGAQGGDVAAVINNGRTADGTGLIINSSRQIIYASSGIDFAQQAREKTVELKDMINSFRKQTIL